MQQLRILHVPDPHQVVVAAAAKRFPAGFSTTLDTTDALLGEAGMGKSITRIGDISLTASARPTDTPTHTVSSAVAHANEIECLDIRATRVC